MFMIRKRGDGQIVFTLSGRIEASELAELQQQLAEETSTKDISLDLENVTLVNQGAVEFFAHCAANHVTLINCPGYIRKWIEQVKRATAFRDVKIRTKNPSIRP